MLIKAGKRKLLTGKPRQEERRTQQMLQSRIANAMAPGIQTELDRAIRDLADSFERTGTTELFDLQLDEHEQELGAIIQREWTRAATMAGERIVGAAKCAHGNYIKKQSIEKNFFESIQNFVANLALARVGLMSQTTIDQVRQRISTGLLGGSSVDQIAQGIRETSNQISGYRSMMIARTEGHSAYNFGIQAGAESSDLMLEKEWISSNDSRTRDKRFDHRAADGEVVGLSEYFRDTGGRLMYPGDPSGRAGNVIHCRCGRGDVLL